MYMHDEEAYEKSRIALLQIPGTYYINYMKIMKYILVFHLRNFIVLVNLNVTIYWRK